MSAPPYYEGSAPYAGQPGYEQGQGQYYNQQPNPDYQQQGGYPPQQQGGYPPQQQGGYPPGYPPQQQGGYPPQQPHPDQQPQQPGDNGIAVVNNPHELDFGDKKPEKFRDPCCAVTFILQLIALIVVCLVYIFKVRGLESVGYDYSYYVDGYFAAMLFISAVVGILFGFIWLAILKSIAGKIIKASIIVHMALYIAITVIAFYYGVIALGVVCLILVLVWALYFWCIRKRIAFSEKMIKYSIKGISKYWGIFVVAGLNCIWMSLFCVLWVMGVNATVAYVYTEDIISTGEQRDGVYYIIWIVYAFFLYWNLETFSNISHLVNCGVMGHWWFQKDDATNVSFHSFRRATTYSLGSVAFGSLLVSIIRFLRLLARSGGANRNLCGAILLCCLSCIERLLEYFNTYAYANVAIYGMTYIEGAKACFKMFKSHGLTMIINDDLTSLALILGCLVGGLITCGSVGTAFYFITKEHYNYADGIYVVPFVFSFLIGFYLSRLVLSQIASAVVATFTCLAMDPNLMAQTRPDEYNKIQKARKKFYK